MHIIVYHHNDEDGWASAAIVKLKHPQTEVKACDYGQEPQLVQGYDEVYVIDFTFDKEKMKWLAEHNKRLIWIDHHASKIKDIDEPYEGIRDVHKAACVLTWEYFFAEENIPLVIQHIADEDIWTFTLKDTEAFNLYLKSILEEGKEVNIIKDIIATYAATDYENAYEKGRLLIRYRTSLIAKQLTQGVNMKFLSHKAMVFFSNVNTSHLGHAALKEHKDIDIAVCIALVPDKDGKPLYRYSLRSRSQGVVVSELARLHGGGGHPQAAGFTIDRLLINDE